MDSCAHFSFERPTRSYEPVHKHGCLFQLFVVLMSRLWFCPMKNVCLLVSRCSQCAFFLCWILCLMSQRRKKKCGCAGSFSFPSPPGHSGEHANAHTCAEMQTEALKCATPLHFEAGAHAVKDIRTCTVEIKILCSLPPAALAFTREKSKQRKAVSVFCSPLPACYRIHLCCFGSSKCLPLSLLRWLNGLRECVLLFK